MTKKQVKASRRKYTVVCHDCNSTSIAIASDEIVCFAKIIVDTKFGQILVIHVIKVN